MTSSLYPDHMGEVLYKDDILCWLLRCKQNYFCLCFIGLMICLANEDKIGFDCLKIRTQFESLHLQP